MLERELSKASNIHAEPPLTTNDIHKLARLRKLERLQAKRDHAPKGVQNFAMRIASNKRELAAVRWRGIAEYDDERRTLEQMNTECERLAANHKLEPEKLRSVSKQAQDFVMMVESKEGPKKKVGDKQFLEAKRKKSANPFKASTQKNTDNLQESIQRSELLSVTRPAALQDIPGSLAALVQAEMLLVDVIVPHLTFRSVRLSTKGLATKGRKVHTDQVRSFVFQILLKWKNTLSALRNHMTKEIRALRKIVANHLAAQYPGDCQRGWNTFTFNLDAFGR